MHTHAPASTAIGMLLLAVTACGGDKPTQPPPPPIQLEPGQVVGKPTFPDGDTEQGGRGQEVSGIPCGTDTVGYHVHAHLSLFVQGEQLAIPIAIGTVDPIITNGPRFVVAARCFYWLHTHDASGVVHVEAPAAREFTLGQFFDVWGEPLSATNVAGYEGALTVYVNGARYTGDPRAIPLDAHAQITLEVGTPVVAPPTYTFPAGY